MHSCCICKFSYETEINIFKERIGDPPVAITDLIHECTQDFVQGEDVINEIKQNNICVKCTGKLLIYYKASLMMKKIKFDLSNLMRKTETNKEAQPNEGWSPIEETPNLTTEDGEGAATAGDEVDIECDDYIKIEYVDYMDSFTDAEDEFILEDMPALMNSKMLQDSDLKIEAGSESSSIFADVIEIEHISTADVREVKEEEHVPNRLQQRQRKRIKNSQKMFIAKCTECDLEFESKQKYNAHRRKDHYAGYICDTCGKTFFSTTGFESHKLTHREIKEFVCNVCGQAFHLKVYLKHHMAWHTGEMNYQCDVCEKRFVHKVALQKHKKIHDDVREITCEICGFKFRTRAHLNRHMLTHTGAKPHSCPICGKRFSQVYNMKVHIREHEKPGSTRRHRVKCNTCAKSFSNRATYEQHCKANICQYVE